MEKTIELLTLIAPLIGVILGSVLTGVGVMFRQRAERKRAISIALADLLEIRHELAATGRTLGYLQSRFDVPKQMLPKLVSFFESMVQSGDSMHKRYEETVSLVSSFDPVLGFKLRSKNQLGPLLSKIKHVAIGEGVDSVVFAEYEQVLRKAMLPHLEKAIAELGKRHSRKTYKEVCALIEKGDALAPEAALVLDELTKVAGSVQPAGARGA